MINPLGRAANGPADTIADARFADNISTLSELLLSSAPNTLDDLEFAACCTASPPVVVKASALAALTADGKDKPEYDTDPAGLAAEPLSPPPLLQPNNARDESRIDPIDNLQISRYMPLISTPEKLSLRV